MLFQRRALFVLISFISTQPYIISNSDIDIVPLDEVYWSPPYALAIYMDYPPEHNIFTQPITALEERLKYVDEVRKIRCGLKEDRWSNLPHANLFKKLPDNYHTGICFESHTDRFRYTIPLEQFLATRSVLLNNDTFIKELAYDCGKCFINHAHTVFALIHKSALMENPHFRKYLVDAIVEFKALEQVNPITSSSSERKRDNNKDYRRLFNSLIADLTLYNEGELLNKLAKVIEDTITTIDIHLLSIMMRHYPQCSWSNNNVLLLIDTAHNRLQQYISTRDINTTAAAFIHEKQPFDILTIKPIIKALIYSGKYPQLTLSERHFFWHCYDIALCLDRSPVKNEEVDLSLNVMVQGALENERTLAQQGKYVFYHIQQWSTYFLADLYTRLWEIKYHQPAHNYLFTRFVSHINNPQELAQILAAEQHIRSTALNDGRATDTMLVQSSLFESMNEIDDIDSHLRIYSWNMCRFLFAQFMDKETSSDQRLTLHDLFNQLQLADIYSRYKQEIVQLQQQFEALNFSTGNILQIAVTPTALKECVYFAYSDGSKRIMNINTTGTSDIVQIMDTLYKKPRKNYREPHEFEFRLILTRDYALKPNNGIEIFAFNTVPADKWQQYCAQRDVLLQKIARELAH